MVKLPKYQFHGSDTLSPIVAKMSCQKCFILMIYPNIVTSQHCPSCIYMTNVMIKYSKYQKQTKNISKETPNYLPSGHPPKCQENTHPQCRSLNKHPASAFNPRDDKFAARLLLGDFLLTKRMQQDDSQCNHAHLAKLHPH
jgi:hypothetical protein